MKAFWSIVGSVAAGVTGRPQPATRVPARSGRASTPARAPSLRILLAAWLLLATGAVLAQTGRLEPGDSQLESGEFFDLYTHEGRAGDTVVVGITSTDFDPYLIVLDPAGAELLQEDDSPGYGLDVHVVLTLPSDGSYTVAVTSARPGETGAYTLTIAPTAAAPTPAPAPAPVNPLPPAGASWSGTFSDGTLTVELRQDGSAVLGRLLFGGREYVVTASLAGGSVQGTFGADGQSYPFAAVLAGEVMTLESGGASYTLQRRTESPAAAPVSPPVAAPVSPPAAVPAGPSATARFFFLPQDAEGVHNTTRPRIETDAAGNIHMVVPGYAGGDAYYLFCPADCRDASQLSTVTLQTDGTAYNAMIALDAAGRPQVLIGAYQAVYYATCAGDCRLQNSWTTTRILQHDPNADREVTGEAFALDPLGRPRFVMHAYRAFLGIGQPTPETLYLACDANCHDPSSWRQSRIAEQIWQESTLRFGPDGRAHLAIVASADIGDIGGYMTCAVDCESGRDDAWKGLGLAFAFSDRNVARIDPAISLALTRDGRPRVLLLGKDDTGARDLSFWSCDAADCTVEAGWTPNYLISSENLGAGLDLTLDSRDRPRAVYNADDNVFLLVCDGDCLADDDGGWDLLPVELAGTIPVDEVIPYYNCNIAAWLLRYPSLALGPDGLPRVAYLAEDISGVLGVQDPLYPACTPGVDMSIGRFARLASLEPPR